jgi:hypothetical protein
LHLPRFRIDTALAVFAGFTIPLQPYCWLTEPRDVPRGNEIMPRMTGNARLWRAGPEFGFVTVAVGGMGTPISAGRRS